MAVPKKIEQNMEVVGRDGAHVGIVERIEGTGEIKLAKDDPDAAGQERYIPLAWLVHTAAGDKPSRSDYRCWDLCARLRN